MIDQVNQIDPHIGGELGGMSQKFTIDGHWLAGPRVN
jgi:hypothetical protein